ncbi:SCO7460 family lipoprotein [Thermomonospora cellulosilytica]|uniref:Lipoprotein n=1 Tax=Thermomonospora cellulosilytica TaxID=1411118 RepID=A0A7W3N5X4_9ACTN|nr:hypothetical protein [Thermomonospora cellulosilytica]MBA9008043.1 hypothetical protein [Thermomonospora cellulosilytica]
MGRWTVLGVVSALLAGGCAVSTREDRRYAAELAERRYPGLLRVIGARPLVPETTGSEITFAVADDPDAVVRLRVDAGKGTCGGRPCDRALDDALARARAEADRWRRLNAAFTRCGHPIVGLTSAGVPWTAAEPTNATAASVWASLGRCAADAGVRSFNVAATAVARRLPAPKRSLPTLMEMTGHKRLAALAARPYYTVHYEVSGGRAALRSVNLIRPFEEHEKFEAAVAGAVRDRLRRTRPEAVTVPYPGPWRLVPGTVDRLAGHVLFCEDGDRQCLGDHAVAVTADLTGVLVGDLRVIRDVRDGPTGPLSPLD